MNEADQLYPGHSGDSARHANAAPLPAPLAASPLPEPIRVGELTIRPFVPYDVVILRKLNSPLYRQMVELSKPDEQRTVTDFDDDEEFEIIYQFITPIEEVRAELARGREHFRERARAAVAYNPGINVLDYAALIAGVSQNLIRGVASSIEPKTKPEQPQSPTPNPQPFID